MGGINGGVGVGEGGGVFEMVVVVGCGFEVEATILVVSALVD